MSKPSNHAVLSYWRAALLDDAQMSISFKNDELVAIDRNILSRGVIPKQQNDILRLKHPKSKDLSPEDPITVMAGLRVLLGERNHAAQNTKSPVLFCMAALFSIEPDGTIKPCIDSPPWINRELLEPSDARILIGDVSVMDAWIEENPPKTGSLAALLEWSDGLWNAVTAHGLPEKYTPWPKVPLQAAESSIGMMATQHQRKFYDTIIDDEGLITPLLDRYLSGSTTPKDVTEALRWNAASMPRGTMTSAYGMSPSQGEAMSAFSELKKSEILAVNGPPGTGKTTLLQGIVATKLVNSAIKNHEPPVIVGTSTNNQAVTNIIDAMKKAMNSGDVRPWAKRWIVNADSLGLYFPSMEKEKSAIEAGYLIASMGRSLETKDWGGFPERERSLEDAQQARETWLKGFYQTFRPDRPLNTLTQAECGEEGSEGVDILTSIENGIDEIREVMSSFCDLGQLIVLQNKFIHDLFAASGCITTEEIITRIEECDQKISERKPKEDELRAELKTAENHFITCRDAADQAKQNIANSKAKLDAEVAKAEAEANEAGKHAIDLIAALPEGGRFSNFFSGKKWSSVEKLVASGAYAEHFRPLMQSQSRVREQWLETINKLTEHTDAQLAEAKTVLETFTKKNEVEMKGIIERLSHASDALSQAKEAFNEYTFATYNLAENRRNKLLSALQNITNLRTMIPVSIAEKISNTKWASSFGLDVPGPWENPNWNGSLLAVEDFLDRTLRYALFQLALRYWEGRWILEVEALQDAIGRNDNKAYPFRVGEKAIKAMYRRWAMLTPLFIITASSLPKLPKFRKREGDKFVDRYLLDFFDLLIVDEAGQISPYQLVPGMAFSQQAVVVGDVYQIEPVVTTSHATDTGNARKAGVQPYFWDDDGPIDPRVVTAPPGNGNLMGSVMRVVQQATTFTSPNSLVPGIFLREHRRCRKDIIEICNELVYKGQLKPMTAEPKEDPPLPPLSWANVNGKAERVGGSQRNLREANAIANWICESAVEWEKFYKKPIQKIVTVITPFGPQRDSIKRALMMLGKQSRLSNISKIKVGTVNAMQGAESDIVIFSPTCDKTSNTNFLESKKSLLNVAISRAVHSFVVIGTMEIFERNPSSTLGILGKALFSKGQELGGVRGNWSAEDSVVLSGHRISTPDEHHALLDEALKSLKPGEEIVIVSPFLSASAVNSPAIQNGIRNAVARGGLVNIVTRAPTAIDYRNGTSPELRKSLQDAGAKLHDIKLLHSKTLMTSDFIAEGSFNWLSVRREEPNKANLDSTWVLKGRKAEAAKEAALEELNALLSSQGSSHPTEVGRLLARSNSHATQH
ncbi:DNA helicase superfamily I [Acetobacter pasteurianus NBRC 3188]|uniref:DNA helicase superfamily I n=2 Tax=Acetobacter pasteurianus TaxID=438 RepID=A0A401WXD6_ACEPA|nr:DNA helicase superfamily I [Acetobacter pasteurianus NBRC 3188]